MDWRDMAIAIGAGLFLVFQGANAYRLLIARRKPDAKQDLFQLLSSLGWLSFSVGFIGHDLPSCVRAEASGWLIPWVALGALFLIYSGVSLGRLQLRRAQQRETARTARTPT
jgi:hypothetical protein